MQHTGGWQRCTEEPGIAMHGVHHCEQWTANRKRERYNMDVYLIRHGKTKGNLEGRYIGTTDEPLCEEGKQSLMQMADAKKYPAVEALFVSPMLRCRESAKILFPKQSISVVSDLRECDFGRYENKNFQELSGDADYQRWLDSNGTLPFPAGEEQSHFRKRLWRNFWSKRNILRRSSSMAEQLLVFWKHWRKKKRHFMTGRLEMRWDIICIYQMRHGK